MFVTHPSFTDALKADLTILVQSSAAGETQLKASSPDTTLNKLYQRSESLKSLGEIKNRLRQEENTAYFEVRTVFPNENKLIPLKLSDRIPNQYAMSFQKGSEIKNIFDHFIGKLKENGSLDKIIKRWEPQINNNNDETQNPSLSINNLVFLYFIVVFGIISAMIILGLEIFRDGFSSS